MAYFRRGSAGAQSSTESWRTSRTLGMSNGTPIRVLIADDDETSRLFLRSILEGIGGLDVCEAVDGQQAWEMLDGGLEPRLCFIDIDMPRLTGLELLKRIRADRRLAGIKVCFCSAVRERQLVMQAAALQPDYYNLKPYPRASIQAQVRKVLGADIQKQKVDSVEEGAARRASKGRLTWPGSTR